MAKSRLELQKILSSISGVKKCYYNPPTGTKLVYPCIMYHLSGNAAEYADDISYKNARRYSVTVVTTDPDSEIPNELLLLPYCTLDRSFINDNLTHFVFTLFF